MRRALVLLLLLASAAGAQVSLRGELSASSSLLLSEAFPAQPNWGLAAHLEAEARRDGLLFRLVLGPRAQFTREPQAELGLSEIYGRVGLDEVDVSLGLERLPLEVARLSLPFSLEPVTAQGVRQGLPGARAVWYPGDWRLRAALVWHEGSLTPVLSARRSFGAFELEGHALHAGRAGFGLGGSGLVGELVLYGDAWLLLSPLEVRGALGLTGFWGDALWTAEAAYAPSAFSPAPHPQVAAQVSLPQGEASWLVSGAVGWAQGQLAGLTGVSFIQTLPDGDVSLSLGANFGPLVTVWSLGVSARSYF